GRGLFMRGRHASSLTPDRENELMRKVRTARLAVPFELPEILLNPLSIQLFNSVYYRKQLKDRVAGVQHYNPFFYPLDGVEHWNRAYGARGFLQYQCVVPPERGRETMGRILSRIAESGMASFLAV